MLECVAVILISIALIAMVFGVTFEEGWADKCSAFWDTKGGAAERPAAWRRDAPDAEWPRWDWHRAASPRGDAAPPDWEWLGAENSDCGWPPEDREATTAGALLHFS